jgi:hypothetical protein
MFDKSLILEYLTKIEENLLHIQERTQNIHSAEDFSKTPHGVDMLDNAVDIGRFLSNLLLRVLANSSVSKITSNSMSLSSVAVLLA